MTPLIGVSIMYNVLKSFIYHWSRGDVKYQTHKNCNLIPWYDWYNDNNGEIEYTVIFMGWLWFQFRWVHV